MDAQEAFDKLDSYSDDELRAVINDRLSSIDENRLYYLGSEEKRSNLTTEEALEFDQLLAQVNYQMLMRSKALLILKERGHDITVYVKTGI